MKIHIVKNGQLKIVLSPEDNIERDILVEIAKSPIQIIIPDRIEILGQNLSDAAIISNIPVQQSITIKES